MKEKSTKNEVASRRLDRAAKHVTTLWFPINPAVLNSIKEGFERGIYDEDPASLLEALKKDFALFTFIVKSLVPIATSERLNSTIQDNPIELIRWAGPARIKEIVSNDAMLPSSHLFDALQPFQADRLRETAIVASTAEVLSATNNLDPESAFGRGVIREIGLNLIAWNYPGLYSRILTNLGSSQSLDEELTKELGFSPTLLAMKIMRPDGEESQSEEDAYGRTWATYDRLCDIGEALARAEHPDTYPSAENDWKLANDYLQKTVGAGAIKHIKNKAIEHSQEYEKALGQKFEPLNNFNPETRIATHSKKKTAIRNKYLQHCPPAIQVALKNLYAEMTDANSTRKVLEQLLRTIIPQAGYTGGCVFVVDPGAFALMPRTIFGSVKLRSIECVTLRRLLEQPEDSILPVTITNTHPMIADSAATALSCAHPVVESHYEDGGTGLTGIYGSLGESRKFGVLYLEAPDSTATQHYPHSLGTFKAMRQALCDALRIE